MYQQEVGLRIGPQSKRFRGRSDLAFGDESRVFERGGIRVGHRGTIRDYPGFSPSVDAEAIRKAIRGIESSSQQWQELKDDLKGDLSGHFEHLMVALVTPPAVFDAKQLRKSMKVRTLRGPFCPGFGHFPGNHDLLPVHAGDLGGLGCGTDEKTLIGVLTERSNEQRQLIAKEYRAACGKVQCEEHDRQERGRRKAPRGRDRDLSFRAERNRRCPALGPESRFCGRREESLKVDEHLAKKDAQILYNAGENRWGTDEDKFTEILCLRSFPQLKLSMDSHYRPARSVWLLQMRSGLVYKVLEDGVKNCKVCSNLRMSTSGNRMGRARSESKKKANSQLQSVSITEKKPGKNQTGGAGTDEFTLNRIMVSRSEIDLLDIRVEFKKRCGYSLYSAIKFVVRGTRLPFWLKDCTRL
ncbi:PREDICTED: annexin A3 [Propithecus coquereli]|uniref:annexin A3 n=1 Tax=Propithecus coquereli TaxID=379532 RepID=UPI00063F279D|nr:PREDICTED: annexin A3 [Propithecus coquereli]